MIVKTPDATESFEQAIQVYNEDLVDLTPSELANEIFLAGRIAARDPRAFVWRGEIHVTARQWADERVNAARALLRRPRGTVRAWGR